MMNLILFGLGVDKKTIVKIIGVDEDLLFDISIQEKVFIYLLLSYITAS